MPKCHYSETDCRFKNLRAEPDKKGCHRCFKRIRIAPQRNPGEAAASRISRQGTARQNFSQRTTE